MCLDKVGSSVERRSAAKFFPEAQQHQPALRPFDSVEAVLAFLAGRHEAAYDQRDEVVHALLSEYQRTSSQAQRLWSSVLLEAFTPLLHSLAFAIKAKVPTKRAREEMVTEAFMLSLGRVNCAVPAPHVTNRLRSKVWQAVLHLLGNQLEYQEHAVPMAEEDLEQELLERGCFDRGPRHFQDQLRITAPQQRSLLFRWLGSSFPAEQLDLIAETVLSGREIREYVKERLAPVSPRDQRRVEDRVRQQQHRVMRNVRKVLRARLARDVTYTRALPQVGR